eukprot:TRINITY_DN3151_c0_g1_i1.p1 TRINITY_DN3151_c0_g1~~TRINITY_DN3151_c0_g1_i1.p1  ORF type:complete len:466 (+),score=66.46 TRINITY_DN3151_c0_g1_i1:176-1399(+)
MDQMDWIEKITGVIASLLSSQLPEQCLPDSPISSGHHRTGSESSSLESYSDLDPSTVEECTSERKVITGHHERLSRSLQPHRFSVNHEKPIDVLRRVHGNDKCADCGSSDPDWASLNLGILVCIECSGVHRNLGVHISKVRSLTLDVKVWEPSVIDLFQSLGNTYANSIWEELLHSANILRANDVPTSFCKLEKEHQVFISKPNYMDPISVKEKFIQAKYVEKLFVRKPKVDQHLSVPQQMWDGIRNNDKKALYRHIVAFDADVNAVLGPTPTPFSTSLTLAKAMHSKKHPDSVFNRHSVSTSEEQKEVEFIEGCSLLHLACQTADIGMIELLVRYGANIDAPDSKGQTPLHHCILRGRNMFAKLLLARGADQQAADWEGKTPMQRAMETETINDEEVLHLFADMNR